MYICVMLTVRWCGMDIKMRFYIYAPSLGLAGIWLVMCNGLYSMFIFLGGPCLNPWRKLDSITNPMHQVTTGPCASLATFVWSAGNLLMNHGKDLLAIGLVTFTAERYVLNIKI